MSDDGNFLDWRLHVFRNLNNSRQCRVTRENSSKEILKHSLDLTIDQVIDFEFVEPVCLRELPSAWTTDDDARLKFLDHRMRHDPDELMSIHGHQVLAGEF